MDKSDHHDYHCYRCGINIEIDAEKPRGRPYLDKDPTHCPYCGNHLATRKEITITSPTSPPLTQKELSKSLTKLAKELIGK